MRWGSQNHNFNLELRMMELKAVSSMYLKWGGSFSELCSSLPEVFVMRIREQSEHMITNELQNTACQVEESRKEAVWRSDCFSGTFPAISVISYFYTGILVLTAWVKVSGSSHAERMISDSIEKKDTNSVIFLFVPFMLNTKSSSRSTMKYFLDIRNFQNSSEIQIGLNMKSLQWQDLLFHSTSFTLL